VEAVTPARAGSPLRIPWWAKLGGKLLLSRLPLPYRWWRRLGAFRHGDPAADAESHIATYRGHLGNYRGLCGERLDTVVEIGPGDTVATALIAAAHGAKRSWLIDIGHFAVASAEHYRNVAARLHALGLTPPEVTGGYAAERVLAASGGHYLTGGLAAFTELPAGSIDSIFSHAVLEHIRRAEFDTLMRESFRVLRPGGVASHWVDLQDHLSGGLQSLRFAPALWEHPLFAGSGFYTNRLRHREICDKARAAGFVVSVPSQVRWPSLPLSRDRLHPAFREFPDRELDIRAFTLVLQKPA